MVKKSQGVDQPSFHTGSSQLGLVVLLMGAVAVEMTKSSINTVQQYEHELSTLYTVDPEQKEPLHVMHSILLQPVFVLT